MKAKMPGKPVETAKYHCLKCNDVFVGGGSSLLCPKCGNKNRTELVPVDIRDNEEEESMYTADDWHGG